MANDPKLEAYLESVAGKSGVLGELLQAPDPDRGLLYTPREIAQQPYLWRQTARLMQQEAPALREFLERVGMYAPDHRPDVMLMGAGTSDYVGFSLADLLRMHFGTACNNWPSTRFTANPRAFLLPGQRYLMIHFARSGNSPESKAVLQFSLKHHPDTVHHLVITCNGDGELAQIAREHPQRVYLIVLHDACNDRGLAMTSSFSNMVVTGQALACLDHMEEFCALIERVALAGEYLMTAYADTIYKLADPAVRRAFYLGNGDLLGAAYESALKVQELTVGQVMAKGEDTLAFRHGPISAVDSDAIITFFLSAGDFTQRYELDVLVQYQRAFGELGVKTVVITDRMPDEDLAEDVLCITYDPRGQFQLPAFYQVTVATLFGQLFGMFSSYRRGLNVDDPSVDKALYSRTVQGVRLYEYAG